MIQTKKIPYKFPGLNDYISAERRNRFLGAKMKKEWTELSELHFKSMKSFTKPVNILFVWTEQNARRDPDNIIFAKKFILDGLKNAGIIPDDTQQWIKSIKDTWLVDKNDVGVYVEISEVI